MRKPYISMQIYVQKSLADLLLVKTHFNHKCLKTPEK